jgi:hypothetical protein
MRVTYDPGFEYEYAENVDQELMAEEEMMLANPAPFEEQVAENPLAAEEGLEESGFMSYDNQQDFDADFRSEERTDSAITDLNDDGDSD